MRNHKDTKGTKKGPSRNVVCGQGFVYRHYEPTIPPAVTYGLTKRMQEISQTLDQLDELAHKWQEEDAKGVRKRKARAV